jgi:hypothetical protein
MSSDLDEPATKSTTATATTNGESKKRSAPKGKKPTGPVFFTDGEEVEYKKLMVAKPFDLTRYGARSSEGALTPDLVKLEKEDKAYRASNDILKIGGQLPDGYKVAKKADTSTVAAVERRNKFRTWSDMIGKAKFKHGDDVRKFMQSECDSLRNEDFYQFDDADGRPHWLLRASEFHEDSDLRKQIPADVLKALELKSIWVERDAGWLNKIQSFTARLDGLTYVEAIEYLPRLVPASVVVLRAVASLKKQAARKNKQQQQPDKAASSAAAADDDSLDDGTAPEDNTPKKSKKTAPAAAVVVDVSDITANAPSKGPVADVLKDFDRSDLQALMEKSNDYKSRLDTAIAASQRVAKEFKHISLEDKKRPKNGFDFLYERFWGKVAEDVPADSREKLENEKKERRIKIERSLQGALLDKIKATGDTGKLLQDLAKPNGDWRKKEDTDTMRAIVEGLGGAGIIYVVHAMQQTIPPTLFGDYGNREAQIANTLEQARECLDGMIKESLQMKERDQLRIANLGVTEGKLAVAEARVQELETLLKGDHHRPHTNGDADMPDIAAPEPVTTPKNKPSSSSKTAKAAKAAAAPPPPPPPAPKVEDDLDL